MRRGAKVKATPGARTTELGPEPPLAGRAAKLSFRATHDADAFLAKLAALDRQVASTGGTKIFAFGSWSQGARVKQVGAKVMIKIGQSITSTAVQVSLDVPWGLATFPVWLSYHLLFCELLATIVEVMNRERHHAHGHRRLGGLAACAMVHSLPFAIVAHHDSLLTNTLTSLEILVGSAVASVATAIELSRADVGQQNDLDPRLARWVHTALGFCAGRSLGLPGVVGWGLGELEFALFGGVHIHVCLVVLAFARLAYLVPVLGFATPVLILQCSPPTTPSPVKTIWVCLLGACISIDAYLETK